MDKYVELGKVYGIKILNHTVEYLKDVPPDIYVKLFLDIVIMYWLVRKLYKKMPFVKMTGIYKYYKKLLFLYIIVFLIGLHGSMYLLGSFLTVALLLPAFIFPNDFKDAIDRIIGRVITEDRKSILLSGESVENISKNIIDLATSKTGALIIIARQSSLDDLLEQDNTVKLGEISIDSDVVPTFFQKESKYKKGAMLIRDDKILGLNVKLPIGKGKDLRNTYNSNRIGAVYGSNTKYDCLVIAVSGTRGTITIGGRINGKKVTDYELLPKEFDIQRGVSKEDIEQRLTTYLKGFGEGDIYKDIENNKPVENKNSKSKNKKSSKQKESKKPNKKLTKEEKLEERRKLVEERNKKRKEKLEQVKKEREAKRNKRK